MSSKLLFENWRRFLNEDRRLDCPEFDPPGHRVRTPEQVIACNKAREKRRAERGETNEAYDKEDHASAAGMRQDLEMRRGRGDFEKGDWGVHGPLGYSDKGGIAGEYSDYAEYPWIRDALESLEDEEHSDKVKAMETLAKELGISIHVLDPDPGHGDEMDLEYRSDEFEDEDVETLDEQ